MSPVYFFSNGSEFINYRHIAGGQSIGGEIGSFININERLQLHLGLTYDHVKYNQHYVLVRTQQESAQLRGYIGMNILLSQTVELELFGSQRAIYDDYFAKLKWLLPVSTKHPIELVGSIEHVVSHNDIPNNTIYLLTLNFSWGVREGYRLASEGAPNVLNWVKSPAVYMQQVLAAADQKTVRITSTPNPITVSPNIGSTAGGTDVTITGSGFTGATEVTFDGVAATNCTVVNDTTITCTTPPHAVGSVNVAVTGPGGTGTLTNGFTYENLPVPSPTTVDPNTGSTAGGTDVTITGSGFTGATEVTFNGVAATNCTVVNDTTITCTTPAHAAGSVNVAVTGPGGTGTLTNGFTYENPTPNPTIVDPNIGSILGGTSVTITGTGFTGATGVSFGLFAATNVTVVDDTTITCTTPAVAIAGLVNVTVTGPGGSGVLINGFTYENPTPNPTTVNPNTGSTAGGTAVTITGTGFTGATGATFDGVAATDFTVVNDTTITCTTPAHAAGSVNVAVTGPGGSGTVTNGFTYENPTPNPTTVNPNTGSTAGGTAVTITGTGFTGATGATFDGVAATDFTVVNDTTITCTTPAHAAGSVNVAVTGPGGSGTVTNGFTYEEPIPNPTSINPNNGPTSGGTNVTITGSGFTGVTDVSFGLSLATNLIVVDDNTITCTTPAVASEGIRNLLVDGPGGRGILEDAFTFENPTPNPTNVSPNSGTILGGTSVTITGSGFTGATGVTFDGLAATSVTVVNDTTITCATPLHLATGSVDVAVTGPGGSGVLPNGYTYTTLK